MQTKPLDTIERIIEWLEAAKVELGAQHSIYVITLNFLRGFVYWYENHQDAAIPPTLISLFEQAKTFTDSQREQHTPSTPTVTATGTHENSTTITSLTDGG